jgi:hypothetical protein
MMDITSFTHETDIQTYNSGNLGFVVNIVFHWFFFSVVLVVLIKGFMFGRHILRFSWDDNSTVEEPPEYDDIGASKRRPRENLSN